MQITFRLVGPMHMLDIDLSRSPISILQLCTWNCFIEAQVIDVVGVVGAAQRAMSVRVSLDLQADGFLTKAQFQRMV